MLRDISEWERIGYGGKSTLEKEELKSPDGLKYLIKYPRPFIKGVSWEDITELIAAEIGTILGLEMMKVEIVTRNGRRGCLLRNFVEEYEAKMYEEGGALLPSLVEGYVEIQESSLRNLELIEAGFQVMHAFDYWEQIKMKFIDMLFFDILIGNQDRHPFNWQILFLETGPMFSPIYDNGASLGFRFEDEQLMEMTLDLPKMNKYIKNTKVKAGMFEKKNVKAKDLLKYIQIHYPNELECSTSKLESFNMNRYKEYVHSLDIINEAQKEWLHQILPFRRQKILDWIGKEEENHE